MRSPRVYAAVLLAALTATGCGDTTAGPTTPPPPSSAAADMPAPRDGVATLDFPVDDGEVHQCEVFRGTADLPEDKTLILGVRNIDNGNPDRYFEAVGDWEYPGDLDTWSGQQWFGSGDSSVGQRFRAELLIIDLAGAKKAIRAASKEGWHAEDNPEGTTVAAHITLTRVAGPGPAECS